MRSPACSLPVQTPKSCWVESGMLNPSAAKPFASLICPSRKILGLATEERAPRRIVRQDRGVLGLATVASAVRAKTAPWARTAAWACAAIFQDLTQPATTSECTNARGGGRRLPTYEDFGHRLLDHGDPADALLSRLPAQRPRAICDPKMRTHGYFTTDQMDVRQRPPQIFSTRFQELFEAEIMSLSLLVDEESRQNPCRLHRQHLP